jgi:hypothetical protein
MTAITTTAALAAASQMFSDAGTAAARIAARRCHGSGLEDD